MPKAGKSRKQKAPKTLKGWKAIGDYLGIGAATAQRWAKGGMPVKRQGRKGELSDVHAQDLIRKVTETVVPFVDEKLRDNTWDLVEEIASGSLGIGGKPLVSRCSRHSVTGVSNRHHLFEVEYRRTTMKIVSVNVGIPREVIWQGVTVQTGIFKEPVAGPVTINKLNLAGDKQADLTRPKPKIFKNRVAYYVGGAEEWRYVSKLAHDSTGREAVFYLHSVVNGGAGVMDKQMPALNEAPDRYTYDPMDIRPALMERNGVNLGWWPHHYLSITNAIVPLNPSPNGLVYETAPLKDDLEISGIPKLAA